MVDALNQLFWELYHINSNKSYGKKTVSITDMSSRYEFKNEIILFYCHANTLLFKHFNIRFIKLSVSAGLLQ